MTALEGLDRLESPGLWRADREAPPRDVHVAVGDAELVIEDRAGAALSHWSLPALVRVNPRGMPACYAPAAGSDEILEIAEPEMVAALDRVMAAVERGRYHPGVLRRLAVGLVAAVLAGALALWLPGALRRQAAVIVPAAQQAEIGRLLLRGLETAAGPACANPLGREALEQFRDRIFPARPVELAVLRDLPRPVVALPGGLLAVSGAILTGQDDPDVAAGHALAAAETPPGATPFEAFLHDMGTLNLARMLLTGEVPRAAVSTHVERLLAEEAPAPSPQALRPAFAAAGLAWEPFARATGRPADPIAPSRMPPALDDTPWQALREICSP